MGLPTCGQGTRYLASWFLNVPNLEIHKNHFQWTDQSFTGQDDSDSAWLCWITELEHWWVSGTTPYAWSGSSCHCVTAALLLLMRFQDKPGHNMLDLFLPMSSYQGILCKQNLLSQMSKMSETKMFCSCCLVTKQCFFFNRWRSRAFFFGGAAPLLPGFAGAVAYPQCSVCETHWTTLKIMV